MKRQHLAMIAASPAARAHQRQTNLADRLSINYFVVMVRRPVSAGIVERELSPYFASRFAAARALRHWRRREPAARLVNCLAFFSQDDIEQRQQFTRYVVLPGERP